MSSEDEFRDFARARYQQLYRSALFLCGDPYGAEDLVQETLTKVYAVWGTRQIDNPSAYSHTTLTRVFLSIRRKLSSTEYLVDALPERPSYDPSMAVRLDLQRALAELSRLDRAIVVMRYLEDRPVEEVAASIRKSSGAVRNRAGRALRKLRQHLHDTDAFDPDPAKEASW